jgi:hypothetical protein
MTEDIIEIENLLPNSYCDEIQRTLFGWDFPWGYNSTLSYGDIIDSKFIDNDSKIKDTDGFVHTFFWGGKKISPYADLVIPLVWFMEQQTNIEIQEIFRIRAVFVNKNETFGNFYNVPHIDDKHDHKSMIYYVNDSDGDTILFKERFSGDLDFNKKTEERRISPKKNKAVVFDGLRYHAGSVPRVNHRVLININFTVKNSDTRDS